VERCWQTHGGEQRKERHHTVPHHTHITRVGIYAILWNRDVIHKLQRSHTIEQNYLEYTVPHSISWTRPNRQIAHVWSHISSLGLLIIPSRYAKQQHQIAPHRRPPTRSPASLTLQYHPKPTTKHPPKKIKYRSYTLASRTHNTLPYEHATKLLPEAPVCVISPAS
jgi:hypothetical protein